jgi:hypothetical protein
MKKLLIVAGCTCILLAIITINSFAQIDNIALSNQAELKKITSNTMITGDKKFSSKISSIMIKSKVIYTFISTFKNVSNLEWYIVDAYYLAEFTMDGRSTRALFYKNGGIFYIISFGSEKDLPVEVRRQIKSNYVDYIITKVSEINSDNKTAWVVNLHDDSHLIIARVIDGELDELGHYKTQPGTLKK